MDLKSMTMEELTDCIVELGEKTGGEVVWILVWI